MSIIDKEIHRIATNFLSQIRGVMEKRSVSLAEMGRRIGRSEKQVRGIFSHPLRFTPLLAVQMARALGLKVAIVSTDADTEAEALRECWERAGMPNNFHALADPSRSSA